MKILFLFCVLFIHTTIKSQSHTHDDSLIKKNEDSLIDKYASKASEEQNSGQFKMAISNYEMELYFKKKNLNDTAYYFIHVAKIIDYANVYKYIGECYYSLNDFKESISYYKIALGIFQTNNLLDFSAPLYYELGDLYNILSANDEEHSITSINNLGIAIKYWAKSINAYLKSNDEKYKVAEIYQNIADAYKSVNDIEKYRFYQQKSDEYYGIH